MALVFGSNTTRASSTSNPITTGSLTIGAYNKVVVLMIKTLGANDRTGGSPTFASQTMTQASTTQKAAASPEAGCELWYLLDPPAGAGTASIPNAGTLTIFYTVAMGRASSSVSGLVLLDAASGGNATSTNPTPGEASLTTYGCLGFAVTAGGWTSWAPSAQIGTLIANTDDGADGGGEQYINGAGPGAHSLSWTFGTSDDWGAVSVYFREKHPVSWNNFMSPDITDSGFATERIR